MGWIFTLVPVICNFNLHAREGVTSESHLKSLNLLISIHTPVKGVTVKDLISQRENIDIIDHNILNFFLYQTIRRVFVGLSVYHNYN